MELLIESVALAGVIAVIAVLCRRAATRLRSALRDDRPLLFGKMIGRRGITPEEIAAAGYTDEIALAARVCAACAAQEQCRVWLAEGQVTGYEAFCPNAPRFPLFEQAKTHKRDAGSPSFYH